MKHLIVFALFALICMARSAPAPATTPRELILPDYHEPDDDIADDEIHIDTGAGEEDEEEEDTTTTTTTTTTTRRSPYVIPTRNRNIIPSRRPYLTERSTSARTTTTTTVATDFEENAENVNEYEGDYKYVKDFRKYIQKLLEDIRKLIQNLTGYNNNQNQRQQYNTYEDDE